MIVAPLTSLPPRREPQGADFERAESEPYARTGNRQARRVLLDQVGLLRGIESKAALQHGARRRPGRLVDADDQPVAVLSLLHGFDDDIGRLGTEPGSASGQRAAAGGAG